MARDVDEIGERIHLVELAAVVVPGAAHFLAAAHMGDGIDEAAVDQAQARRRKARVGGQAVRAIGVLQQRRGAIAHEALAVHQRYGNSRAVARRGEQEFGSIVRGIEAADDRIALQQNLLAGAHVVVVEGGRRGERGIRVAHEFGVELRIDRQRRGIGGLIAGDEKFAPSCAAAGDQGVMLILARPPLRTETARNPLNTSKSSMKVSSRCATTSRQRGAVAFPADRHLHQAKIAGLPIGSDDEGIAEMFQLVFMIAFVRQEDLEFERRIIGMRVPPFRGHRAFHVDENEALGFRFGDAGVEALVRLLECQGVVARVLPRARAF